MMKRTKKITSFLLVLVMLLSLLPVPAQAATIKDPIIPDLTTLTFKTEPQSGTAKITESYAFTWATNKTPTSLTLQIWVLNRDLGEKWVNIDMLTGTSGTLTYRKNTLDYTYVLGGESRYRIVASYQSKLGDPETAMAEFSVNWISYHTITFDANGGTSTMEPGTCEIGEEYTLPECGFTAPAEKLFDGWSVGGENKEVGDTITVSDDTTVTAVWKNTPLVFVTQPENGTSEKAKPCTFSWKLNHEDAAVRLMVYNSAEKEWEMLSDDLTGKTSASYAFAGADYCTGNETKLKLRASVAGQKAIDSEPFVIVWKDFLTYPTWVLGRPITEGNMNDVLGDGKISYTPAQGTAPARLTLNGVFIDKPYISGSRSPIDSEEELIIQLKGDNTVNGQGVSAIYTSCSLYLQSDGTGSLSLYGPNYVIWTLDASISFSGLKELNLSNKNAIAPAIYAYGEISISDCGLVTSTNAFQSGLLDIILQNSTIRIQATRDDDSSAAVIDADRAIKIRNAQVEITAASDSVKGKYSGMYANDGITISAGSNVTMTDVVNGIRSGDSLIISDSDVSVSASECAIKCSSSRTINLNGCAINTAKTPAEISGSNLVNPDTEEIATAVVIERTSAVTQYKVSVKVNNSKWGSVQVFGLDSEDKIDAGAPVTLRATAKAGCRFVGWKVGDTYLSEEPEYSAVITGDTTITAEFLDELVYDTWITGVQVSSKNMKDVLGDGKVSYVPAQGTISAVLTLKGVDLTYEDSPVYTQEELTIEVQGHNKLKSTKEYGIELNRMDKNLYINGNGTGSLTVESYDDGIISRLGKVYLDGLKALDITAGIGNSDVWDVEGIYAFSGLSIKDCALVRTNNRLGSYNGGDREIKMTIDNSRVEVRMPEGTTYRDYVYHAIHASEGLDIINGSCVQIEASDPTGNNTFNGIYVPYDTLSISDSFIKVKDAEFGIYGGEGITINRSHIYLETSEYALIGYDDLGDDPDLYAIKLNGCQLTMPNTKLLTTVREDYDEQTKVVYADTEENALVCSIGTTISEVKILGFTHPVSGAALDNINVHRGYAEELASYEVTTNAWYKIDPATGTGSTMSNGNTFEVGGTYRYSALITRKAESFDGFPASAEDITVTIEGLDADYEMDVYFDSDGMGLTCDVLFVLDTAISGTVTVSGSKATAKVTVENFSDTEATLLVAQYRGGQMVKVQSLTVTADGTFVPTKTFSHRSGDTYKAFLADADTFAPLCAAETLT